MRAIVLCDDPFHPGETARAGLQPLERNGFIFEYLENGTDIDPSVIESFTLVVLAKSNAVSKNNKQPWMTNASQGLFQKHVQNGNGLVVIHSGTSGYETFPAMHKTIGGAFVRHPPECIVTIEPKIGHSITKGVTPFEVYDEHYFVELEKPEPDIFLYSRSEHGVQPAGWTQEKEAGRVCVLTPGHNVKVWLHPTYQKLLMNTLLWTAKLESA